VPGRLRRDESDEGRRKGKKGGVRAHLLSENSQHLLLAVLERVQSLLLKDPHRDNLSEQAMTLKEGIKREEEATTRQHKGRKGSELKLCSSALLSSLTLCVVLFVALTIFHNPTLNGFTSLPGGGNGGPPPERPNAGDEAARSAASLARAIVS